MILLITAVLEIVIYFTYVYSDQILSLDTSLNAFLYPERKRRIIRTEDHLQDMASILNRTSSSLGYGDIFEAIQKQTPTEMGTNSQKYHHFTKEEYGINYTLLMLERMGINQSEIIHRQLLPVLPPWWQILENYGRNATVLGVERCQAYQERVMIRHLGPVGLFSSGTNLLQQLLYDNCKSPIGGQRRRLFTLWQSPWGKHNPASLRLKHIAKHQEPRNQSAVLPIVMVRHPYTWLFALCQSSYSLFWTHNPDDCHHSLFLQNPVRAMFGSHLRNMTYDSLIHVWRDWNLDYFKQTDYPMLIVRMEDLVFRPMEVVRQVCHCAGGKLQSEIDPMYPFIYTTTSANLGTGHGDHRSDLLSSFIRQGRPLSSFRKLFIDLDWRIVNETLADDHGLIKTLGYKL